MFVYCLTLTLSSLNLSLICPFRVNYPFQAWIYYCHLHPLQAANCCRNSRLVEDEDDIWSGLKIKENCHVLLNQFHGNFCSKTFGCRKIKSVFRHVKSQLNSDIYLPHGSTCVYVTVVPYNTWMSQTISEYCLTMLKDSVWPICRAQ